MALLFMEGFDAYKNDGTEFGPGKWTFNSANNAAYTFVAGLYGGKAFRSGAGVGTTFTQQANKVFPSTYTTLILGFRYKNDGDGLAEIIAFRDNANAQVQTYVRYNTGNLIEVLNGDGAVLGSFAIAQGAWVYLEFKVTFNATTGSVVAKADGVQKLNLTNVDTVDNSGGNYADSIGLGLDGTAGLAYLDDLYVCDTSGATANDFLGDVYVETLFPSGDNSVQFSRSGGTTNAENVDELNRDGDTTYVHSTTATHKDLYDFTNLAAGASNVHGVTVNCVHKKVNAGGRLIKLRTKSSTDEQVSSSIQLFQSYVHSSILFPTKDGTNPWTPTLVDGAQFGFELE